MAYVTAKTTPAPATSIEGTIHSVVRNASPRAVGTGRELTPSPRLRLVEVAVELPAGDVGPVGLGLGPAAVDEAGQQLGVEGVDEDVVGQEGVEGLVEVAWQRVVPDAVALGRVERADRLLHGRRQLEPRLEPIGGGGQQPAEEQVRVGGGVRPAELDGGVPAERRAD